MNKKKKNSLDKVGQTIKDTLMEMGESLAGWIDDTGEQFNPTKAEKISNDKCSRQQTKKSVTQKSGAKQTENKK